MGLREQLEITMIFPPRFDDVSRRISVYAGEECTTMGAVGLTHLPHLKLPAIEHGMKIEKDVTTLRFEQVYREVPGCGK